MQEVSSARGIYNARHTSSHSLFSISLVISSRNAFWNTAVVLVTNLSFFDKLHKFCLKARNSFRKNGLTRLLKFS